MLTSTQAPSIIKIDALENHHYEMHLGHFKRGYGETLGNILRRIIMAHIPGDAITHVGIPGVVHDYQIVPYMAEDLLLFKERLRYVYLSMPKEFDRMTIKVRVKGPCTVRAGIFAVQGIKVVHPDNIICVINEHIEFELLCHIMRNTGYVLKYEHDTIPELPIKISAIFNPILNVAFKVLSYPQTKNELLVLKLRSNGTISPRHVLNLALSYFCRHMNMLQDLVIDDYDQEDQSTPAEYTSLDFDKLDLSKRIITCLKNANISTVDELLKYPQSALLKIKNFGHKSLQELIVALAKHGLTLT